MLRRGTSRSTSRVHRDTVLLGREGSSSQITSQRASQRSSRILGPCSGQSGLVASDANSKQVPNPQLQPSRPPNVYTVAALLPDLTTPRISSLQISRMLLEEGSEEVLSAIGSRGEGKRDHRQLMAAVLLVQVHLTLTL